MKRAAMKRAVKRAVCGFLAGWLFLLGTTVTSPRAEAYTVPVIDIPNLIERAYEIFQRALELGIEYETLVQAYEIYQEARKRYEQLSQTLEHWDLDQESFVFSVLAEHGFYIGFDFFNLLHDLDRVLDRAEGIIYLHRDGPQILRETFSGFDMEVSPRGWEEMEAEWTERIMSTHEALLEAQQRIAEESSLWIEERRALENVSQTAAGNLQALQTNTLMVSSLADVLQAQNETLALSLNAAVVAAAERYNRDANNGKITELLMMEGSRDGPGEIEGGHSFESRGW